MLLLLSDSVTPETSSALDRSGHLWKHAVDIAELTQSHDSENWHGVVVEGRNVEHSIALCKSAGEWFRHSEPIIVVVSEEDCHALMHHLQLFDDFVLTPMREPELGYRLEAALRQPIDTNVSDVVDYGPLQLNVTTYQASVAGRPLDMTYMEYELLKYFVTNPERVLTRQQLLKDVWGYEYFGGARTVDVHVRRLRAKLGEEHAQFIQTVRSVGYLFGRERLKSGD